MAKVRYWSLDRLALMIVKMLLNKFDCFMVIEGNRGLGKSTLAFLLEKKIHNAFRKVVRETGGKKSPYMKWHEFNPIQQLKNPNEHKYILYKQDDVINFYDKWHKSGIADEMINVAFNREFWSENQKNLIKMINMNRDHSNLLIACVPHFQNLDTQIKNLCKIRITVVRRGLAVIQTPNRTIYNKDRWDSANNERIEREWFKKGTGLPKYSLLNTFRGMLKFKALNKKEQEIYDKIKFVERNTIKGDLGVTDDKTPKVVDPFDRLYEKLIKGGVRNSTELEGFAFANNISLDTVKRRLEKMLRKNNVNPMLSQYYYDKKAKKKDIEMEKELFAS